MSPRNERFQPVDPEGLGVASHHAKIDPEVASPARIYNYWLGGKDNFASDRDAADQFEQAAPHVRTLAQQNRAFMVRAARTVAEAGVDQFVDLGSGIPASPNVHEVVRAIHPAAQVVYVDNDPIVLAHNRALRETPDGVRTIDADLTEPALVLGHPGLTALIDLDRPVGLLGIAVLHFVAKPGVLTGYAGLLAPGSHIAVSVGSSVGMTAGQRAAVEGSYSGSTPITLRTYDEIAEEFTGLDVLDPGLVNMAEWRPGPDTDTTELTPVVLAGLARVA